jgi:uncharacterized protein
MSKPTCDEIIDVHAPRGVRRPLMFQDWRWLTFLHWSYEPRDLQRFLPNDLKIDTFNGAAWVSLTPFSVVNLRPPAAPVMPWLSSFPETNVRTYVRGPDGARGIWFFTLEAARLLAVLGARSCYGLPYRWANMAVDVKPDFVEYHSRRRGRFLPACSHIRVRMGGPLQTSAREAFLTARFRLYSVLRGRLTFADVEHEPWPLQTAEVLRLEENLLENCGLPRNKNPPLVHYSPGVHVRIGAPRPYNP